MRRKYLPTLLLPLKLFFWKVLKQCSLSAPNAAKRRKKKRVRQARLRLSFPLRFYLHHHQRQCWHSLKIGFQKNSFWQSFESNLWKCVSVPKFYFSRTSFFQKLLTLSNLLTFTDWPAGYFRRNLIQFVTSSSASFINAFNRMIYNTTVARPKISFQKFVHRFSSGIR